MPWPWGIARLAAATAFLAGCATTPGGVTLPAGTLLLGEVRHVLTREMVNASELTPGEKRENLAQTLRNCGLTDAQIDEGRIVVVRDLIYWNNTASGTKRSQLKPVLVAQGLNVDAGNVVDIAASTNSYGIVQRVRARSLAEGGCYYGDVATSAAHEVLGALSLVGASGSASLYCAGIEREGWQRPRTLWHRLPATAEPASDAPPAPPQMIPVGPEPAQEVQVAMNDGLATLLIYRNRTRHLYFSDLPVWVDGEQAALLDNFTCDIVLVAPGDHVVVAGTGASTMTFSRRELTVSTKAGERVVLEYTVDDKVLDGVGVLGAFQREKWEPQAYRFTQRPGQVADTCAIRHPPTILRSAKPPMPEKGQ